MKEGRIKYWDLGAGVMILWMMVYHAVGPGIQVKADYFMTHFSTNYDWKNPMVDFPIFLFFMAWFFYKSGYFFNIKEPMTELKNDCTKLLSMWAIWTGIGYVLHLFFGILDGLSFHTLTYTAFRTAFFEGRLQVNGVTWFLLTLFAVRQISNIAFKKIHPIIIMMISIALAYACNIYDTEVVVGNNHIPYWVSNTFSGMAFFSMGYWMKDKDDSKWLSYLCGIGYVLAILLYYLRVTDLGIVDMLYNRVLVGHYLVWYPLCFTGIIAFNALLKWISQLYTSKLLEFIGKNAMYYFVTHLLVIVCVRRIILKYVPNWFVENTTCPVLSITLIIMVLIFVLITPCIIGWNEIKKKQI